MSGPSGDDRRRTGARGSEPVPAAGALLFHPSGDGPRFLLLRNALHKSWGFPKGHAEEGESPLECARREVSEETGGLPWTRIEGFREECRYLVPGRHPDRGGRPYEKRVVYFLGRVDPEDLPLLRLSAEHDDHRWLPLEEALTLLEHRNLRDLLHEAVSRLRSSGT